MVCKGAFQIRHKQHNLFYLCAFADSDSMRCYNVYFLCHTGTSYPYQKAYASAVGFSTVIILQLLTSSIIMFSLGIIGFYLSKIYEEIKQRPRYIIRDIIRKDDEEKKNGKD